MAIYGTQIAGTAVSHTSIITTYHSTEGIFCSLVSSLVLFYCSLLWDGRQILRLVLSAQIRRLGSTPTVKQQLEIEEKRHAGRSSPGLYEAGELTKRSTENGFY